MKKSKWLDKFENGTSLQENPNNSVVKLPPNYVGLGYDISSRNFSPAWGGQFQGGGELIPVSPTQQIARGVQANPTVPYLQTKDPAEFYKSWIQSPEYARRQLLTGYSSGEDLYMPNAAASRESRLGAIEEMTPITYSTRQPSEAKPGVYGSPSYVNINPSDYIDTSKETIQAHELAHIAGAMGEVRPGMMSAKEQEIFKKSMLPMKEPVLSGVQGSKEREASKRALEDWKHSQEPDEAKADLDALRFMMYDKGIYDITKGKKFTETDFEKAKQNLGKDRVFKRLTDRVGKKNFVNLMNTIAKADDQEEEAPIAMGGMSIPGSVGFTYARTAGAAPSNGPYAKKTKASAQNGIIADKIAGLELKMSPEYQRLKYLQSLPQLRQAPGRGEELVREGLATADIATDLMQIGNFIPHPMAQGVGKAGNILGSGVDLAQALMSARQGDYLDAAINVGSVGLAGGLAANTFRRNSKYLQPGQPLYALSPQAFGSLSRTNYIEPFRKVGKMTDKNLLANRALLGLIGAETVYDAIPQKEYGGEIPSAQSGIMTPMLLARNVLNYFYPSEETAPTVSAAPVEYKKGLTDELLKRQAYKESTFNPAAVSPAGYKGLTQIGEEVLTDYSKKKGGKKLDPFNPKDAVELQKFAMDDLYNASFINKPDQPDSVRLAKTLAAYNWGRGNLFNYLNEQKQKGVDIYDSYDWLNDLPKETSDYVNKILLQEDQSFNKNYKRDSTNPKYKDVTSLYGSKEFGGDIPSAQNGQEMKFYQNGLDWKPKSMQEGGKIYEGQELPEFVVEGKDERMKEAMSQGIRKFYGYVDELMGAPQKEAMQLITGKEQTPSEAWGFQKPGDWLDNYSSFGKNLSNSIVDAVLDPVNAIPGVGLVDDLTRGAVRGAAQNAVSNTLKYGVTPYSYSPEVLAMIPENLVRGALGKPKRFPAIVAETTAKDPNVKRTIEDTFRNREDAWSVYLGLPPENKGLRLVGSDEATGLSKYELTKPRVMNVEDVKNYKKIVDRSTIKRDGIYERLNLYRPGDTVVDNDKLFGVMGGYSKFVSPDGKSIMYRDVWDLQPFSRFTSRELPTDFLGNAIRNFEASSLIPGAKPFVSEGKLADIKTKFLPARPYKDIKTRFNEQLNYVSGFYQPEDYIKDIDNPTPEEIFNYDQMLRDAAKRTLLERIKNERTFLNPLPNQDFKKYADFAPYIKVDKSKKKDGGIVKDNQGYWNPENWGKPVEIDSNNITMEGVYEPLLGVSDTGDTKLMKPGKNYKFKGKKVTEFPVAELGINQLDAQPMKKLNQLLNFTNNPDKDNWLDKYN